MDRTLTGNSDDNDDSFDERNKEQKSLEQSKWAEENQLGPRKVCTRANLDDAVPPGPPGLVPGDGDVQDAAMEDERHDQGVPVKQMKVQGPLRPAAVRRGHEGL